MAGTCCPNHKKQSGTGNKEIQAIQNKIKIKIKIKIIKVGGGAAGQVPSSFLLLINLLDI